MKTLNAGLQLAIASVVATSGCSDMSPPSDPRLAAVGQGLERVEQASQSSLVPLHRYFSGPSQDHFYTRTDAGRSVFSYDYEGVECKVHSKQQLGTAPFYRYWNPRTKDHYYTATWSGRRFWGYTYERVEGYVYTSPGAGLIPLYVLWNSKIADHFYTTSERQTRTARNWGYAQREIAAYVLPNLDPPAITKSSIIGVKGKKINIDGENFHFSPDSTSHYLKFYDGRSTRTINSHDAKIDAWGDRRITVTLPSEIDSEYTVTVVTGKSSETGRVPLDIYTYAHVDSGGGLPLCITRAPDGTIWTGNEFSRGIYSHTPGTSSMTYHDDVQHETHEIFVRGGPGRWEPAHISSLHEDIAVDSSGDVWYTQGGSFGYAGGVHVNASRVVRYTPRSGKNACFNIPTDNVNATGLLLEESKVWVTTRTGGVINFDPSTFTQPGDTSCTFDWRSAAPVGYCTGTNNNRCFKRYSIDGWPAHLAKDSNGNVWVSQFFGDAISRIQVRTGVIREYPLPPARYKPAHMTAYPHMVGPWDIHVDSHEKIWFAEHFVGRIAKFDPALTDRYDCTRLDKQGNNPCLIQYEIPEFDHDHDFVHTLAFDLRGNLWFSAHTYPRGEGTGFIGRLDTNGEFQLYPTTHAGITGGISEFTFDPTNGGFFINEFSAQRLGRLVPWN